MPKVAKTEEKSLKAKINVSLDADLVVWLNALVNVHDFEGAYDKCVMTARAALPKESKS